jgi:hypothetical protein
MFIELSNIVVWPPDDKGEFMQALNFAHFIAAQA